MNAPIAPKAPKTSAQPTLTEQIAFVESCMQAESALSPAMRSPVREWMTPHILMSLRSLSASYAPISPKAPTHFRAYNARSTRPIWHVWPNSAGASDEDIAVAVCGAKAIGSLLDENTHHLHGCRKCYERANKLGLAVQP